MYVLLMLDKVFSTGFSYIQLIMVLFVVLPAQSAVYW